eukprot:6203501-Pleurochrysis_carterae.AAC.2
MVGVGYRSYACVMPFLITRTSSLLRPSLLFHAVQCHGTSCDRSFLHEKFAVVLWTLYNRLDCTSFQYSSRISARAASRQSALI